MITDLNRRLEETAAKIARLDKVERRMEQLVKSQHHQLGEVDRAKNRMSKEQADVEELSKLSLQNLFATVLGSKETKLEQERQEAVAAHLHYEEAIARRDAIMREMNELTQERNEVRQLRREYEDLLAAKEKAVAASPGQAELFRLTEDVQQARWVHQQLDEAISAGKTAEGLLSQAADRLDSAKDWGTWDMLGGGLLATMAKHGRMDEAKDLTIAAQSALDRFQRELADVNEAVQVPDVEVGGFSKFADFFFDGLIADWVVQNKINNSLDAVQSTGGQVYSIVRRLESQREDAAKAVQRAEAARAAFVESYQG